MKHSDFEGRFTAWLDGQLTEDDRLKFEGELVERGFDPAGERAAARRLGDLLGSHSIAPTLRNPDFFNHQLRHRIAQEEPAAASQSERRGWWSLPRLAFGGAFCLVVAAVLFQTLIPRGSAPDQTPYFAEVIDARPLSVGISADTIYTARDNVTVVWIDGLDYLPASYQLQ